MATAAVDANAMMNGVDAGSGSDHDNSNIRVGNNEHGLAQRTLHIHAGSAWDSVTEKVGEETLPGPVMESIFQVI